jgi:hypothetical protein
MPFWSAAVASPSFRSRERPPEEPGRAPWRGVSRPRLTSSVQPVWPRTCRERHWVSPRDWIAHGQSPAYAYSRARHAQGHHRLPHGRQRLGPQCSVTSARSGRAPRLGAGHWFGYVEAFLLAAPTAAPGIVARHTAEQSRVAKEERAVGVATVLAGGAKALPGALAAGEAIRTAPVAAVPRAS